MRGGIGAVEPGHRANRLLGWETRAHDDVVVKDTLEELIAEGTLDLLSLERELATRNS